MSLIANAEVDGDRLTDAEFAMFWMLLIVAGNETTRNALSGAIIALAESDQWRWLAEHPEHMHTAVEELLRFVSPIMQFSEDRDRKHSPGEPVDQGGRQGRGLVQCREPRFGGVRRSACIEPASQSKRPPGLRNWATFLPRRASCTVRDRLHADRPVAVCAQSIHRRLPGQRRVKISSTAFASCPSPCSDLR